MPASPFGHPSARRHSEPAIIPGAAQISSCLVALDAPFSDIYAFGIPRAVLRNEDKQMRSWKCLAILTLSVILLGTPGSLPAQVAIHIGPEPVCPYGYYDFAPYHCAPYGYYGPAWFS